MTVPAIDVDGVTVYYGEVQALDRVRLTVDPGRVCALIGMNGSGKSTLFKTLMGLVTPDRGTVRIGGAKPLVARRAGLLGYVPQNEAVDWSFPLSVRDVVTTGRYGRMGFTRRASRADRAAVGSSDANLFTSVSGGINALWGPLHGGANQAVLEMLDGIKEAGGDVKEFIRKVKNKEDGVKLMGFGHRVYRNYDPRAAIAKKHADTILSKLGSDPLFDIAQALEEAALTDDYFVERKLYPNVDFYTGVIYKAMGFPTRMFTVLFAMGRLPGWIAHWREMHSEAIKIGRPRQIYTGYGARDYTDITNR